jgi:isocitrate dehydrogenase
VSYADSIENALLVTLEHGVHTGDFGDKSIPASGTTEFTNAIIQNLGRKPVETPSVSTGVNDFNFSIPAQPDQLRIMDGSTDNGIINGFDVFVHYNESPQKLADIILSLLPDGMKLQVIANRGTQVWPEASIFTDSIPHYQARIITGETDEETILEASRKLSSQLDLADIAFLKEYDGQKGYSLMQGQ